MPHSPDEDGGDPGAPGLGAVYGVRGPQAAGRFYDAWAEGYEDELAAGGYVTPQRCAEALARFAPDPAAPIMDLGCGTGLSGLALRAAGFTCIDGFDLSEGMLAKARAKGVYRALAVADLGQPLPVAEGAYAHAAAVGCISPQYMPATVLDEILGRLPAGGCLVFSLNDRAAADGTVVGRVNELVDTGHSELLLAERGEHIPGIGLEATVYVLRRRG